MSTRGTTKRIKEKGTAGKLLYTLQGKEQFLRTCLEKELQKRRCWDIKPHVTTSTCKFVGDIQAVQKDLEKRLTKTAFLAGVCDAKLQQ